MKENFNVNTADGTKIRLVKRKDHNFIVGDLNTNTLIFCLAIAFPRNMTHE